MESIDENKGSLTSNLWFINCEPSTRLIFLVFTFQRLMLVPMGHIVLAIPLIQSTWMHATDGRHLVQQLASRSRVGASQARDASLIPWQTRDGICLSPIIGSTTSFRMCWRHTTRSQTVVLMMTTSAATAMSGISIGDDLHKPTYQ